MIKDKIFRIKDNVFFVPFMHTIFETDGSRIDEEKFLKWIKETTHFEYPKQKVNDPRYSVMAQLLLTNKCNLACRYCYSGMYRSNQTMDKDCVTEIVNNLFKNSYHSFVLTGKKKTVFIYFHGGGEPTQAWDELLTAVERAKELSAKYDIKVKFKIASNGMFSDDQLTYLIDNGFDVRISLDGIGELNDFTRVTPKQKSSFPVVARNLDRLNEEHAKFEIAAVVTKNTLSHMKEFAEYVLKRWGNVSDIRYASMSETELTTENKIECLNEDEFSEAYKRIVEFFIENGFSEYKKYLSYADFELRKHSQWCSPSNMNMPVYNVNGDILRCNQYVFNDKFKIGKYENGHLIFDQSSYQNLFDEIKNVRENCEECVCASYCGYSRIFCPKKIDIGEEFCKQKVNYYNKLILSVYKNPELISVVKIDSESYKGIKKIIHWRM